MNEYRVTLLYKTEFRISDRGVEEVIKTGLESSLEFPCSVFIEDVVQVRNDEIPPGTLPQQERDALAIATASDADIQDLCLSMDEDPREVALNTRRILTQAMVRYGETIDIDARKPRARFVRKRASSDDKRELRAIETWLKAKRRTREPWA